MSTIFINIWGTWARLYISIVKISFQRIHRRICVRGVRAVVFSKHARSARIKTQVARKFLKQELGLTNIRQNITRFQGNWCKDGWRGHCKSVNIITSQEPWLCSDSVWNNEARRTNHGVRQRKRCLFDSDIRRSSLRNDDTMIHPETNHLLPVRQERTFTKQLSRLWHTMQLWSQPKQSCKLCRERWRLGFSASSFWDWLWGWAC